MIKFDNVAIGSLKLGFYLPMIYDEIKERNLRTVQDLVDAIETSPEVNWHGVEDLIWKMSRCMVKENARGKEPIIYETNKYKDSTLNYTDSLNDGSCLLLSSPTLYNATSYVYISDLSIEALKRCLTLTDFYGDNYLVRYARNIGSKKALNLVNLINMYTEQVERQAKLTNLRDINVFKFQHDEKENIVSNNYGKIIEYLVDDKDDFVWGILSDSNRKMYLSSIDNYNQMDCLIRDRMIRNVTNYTTLSELKDIDNGDCKVLKRFKKKV